MPVLLRLALVAVTLVVLYGGAAVLALGAPSGPALLGGSFALAGVVLPPMVAGAFVSYWSWDTSDHRRLRTWLVVLAAVQIASAAGLVAASLSTATPAIGVIAVLAAAALLDPVAILLGRAARRRDRRTDVRDDHDAILAGIRSGWRRAGIGAIAGAAIGAVGWVVLASAFGLGGLGWRSAFVVPMSAALGADLGIVSVTLTLATRVRDLLGGRYSSSRRIGRAISGKPEVLSADEEDRATRYASIAPAWLRLQQAAQSLNVTVSLAVVANLALSDPGLQWALWAFGVLVVATAVAAVILTRVQLRRFRRWVDGHPRAATAPV